MDKPSDVFDRGGEWAALTRFAADQRAGASLGVVSGRRRQGKSFLLEALCEAAGGFYFCAREGTDAESLAFLGRELGEFVDAPAPLRFETWAQAIDALLALGGDQPLPVVLDELPHLVHGNRSLPSIIQAAYGPRC